MKRAQDSDSPAKAVKLSESSAPSTENQAVQDPNDVEMGEFEDPYGDDFESEDEIFEAGEDGEPPEDDEAAATKNNSKRQVYVPQRSGPLGANEVMEADYSVYHMLHSVNVSWPCLSFDILPDTLGSDRRSYPQSMYLVTGTQAKRAKDNEIVVMKLSSLGKTMIKDEESDDEESDDDDGYDSDPVLENKSLPTNSTTNRIRCSPFGAATDEYLTASMAEDGQVHIWDITKHVHSLDKAGVVITPDENKPVFSVKNHGSTEGYGIDWSPLIQSGALLTGDMKGNIYHTSRTTSGWVTDPKPYHCSNSSSSSVEDIQWSPVEKTVFASAGGDGHVHIWDTRQATHKPALSIAASDVDVNVMSWNRKSSHLLATGADDGKWAVWDLRTFSGSKPAAAVAQFDYHKAPITSLEFHPEDESVVAVGSEDSTVTLWDLAVEADDEEVAAQRAGGDLDGVPAQLLFVHWQPHVKELHWHKQIPGTIVSTGSEGFSMWRTISV